MTQEPISEKEHSFTIDGTCLPTSIKQDWENDKQKLAKENAQKEKKEAMKKEELKKQKHNPCASVQSGNVIRVPSPDRPPLRTQTGAGTALRIHRRARGRLSGQIGSWKKPKYSRTSALNYGEHAPVGN